MKHCKTSIISSIIAGILICGMLAACGEVGKQHNDKPSNGKVEPNSFSFVQ